LVDRPRARPQHPKGVSTGVDPGEMGANGKYRPQIGSGPHALLVGLHRLENGIGVEKPETVTKEVFADSRTSTLHPKS